jgi:hypothetical protein
MLRLVYQNYVCYCSNICGVFASIVYATYPKALAALEEAASFRIQGCLGRLVLYCYCCALRVNMRKHCDCDSASPPISVLVAYSVSPSMESVTGATSTAVPCESTCANTVTVTLHPHHCDCDSASPSLCVGWPTQSFDCSSGYNDARDA